MADAKTSAAKAATATAAAPAAPTNLEIVAPSDGQIALTAHNDGDGTWSVTRGPGGTVLDSGLPREKALAIVGAATGPYVPGNEQEQNASDHRRALEEKTADIEVAEMFKSDAELAADGNALIGDSASNRPASGTGVPASAGLGGGAPGNGGA